MGSGGSRSSGGSGGSRSKGSGSSNSYSGGGIISGFIIGIIYDIFIAPIYDWILASPLRSGIACAINLCIAQYMNSYPPGNVKAWSVFFYLNTVIFYGGVVFRNWVLALITFIACEYGAYYHAFILQDICSPDQSVICFICLNIFITPLFAYLLYKFIVGGILFEEKTIEKRNRKMIKNISSRNRVDIKKADENMAKHILNNEMNKHKNKKKR